MRLGGNVNPTPAPLGAPAPSKPVGYMKVGKLEPSLPGPGKAKKLTVGVLPRAARAAKAVVNSIKTPSLGTPSVPPATKQPAGLGTPTVSKASAPKTSMPKAPSTPSGPGGPISVGKKKNVAE